MAKIYNWKRFWCPRGGNINLSDHGYLVDPDSEYGKMYNQDLVSSNEMKNVSCLVYLGEPGMGKSFALKSEQDIVISDTQNTSDDVISIDLRSYKSEERLIKNLFNSFIFTEWESGSHKLYIYLDSLDECLLRMDNVCALLLSELKGYPVERLFLRIASRTAEWPISFENGLIELWKEKNVSVYELAPLRKSDVIEAAKTNNLNDVDFLNEIERKEVIPFAIKPVTLTFLLTIFTKNMEFPSTKSELYLEGCRLLCEEIQETRPSGNLDSKQRLMVAARIAAVTMFCNKYAIWKKSDFGDMPEEDVLYSDFFEEKEVCESGEFQINEEAVLETLSTGLFSSRGPHRMGWSHQTFAEFLGSWYLVKKGINESQAISLITHSDDPDQKIPPQLHESVGWLTTFMPEVFQVLIERDPEVLLRSDIATFEQSSREKLTDSLLKLIQEDKLLQYGYRLRDWYKKLNHPNLMEQLRPFISDKLKNEDVRYFAIDVAEACELKGLQEDILSVALDESELFNLRCNAVNTSGINVVNHPTLSCS